MRMFWTLSAFVLMLVGHQLCTADDAKTRDKALVTAEERLKAIYERREFAPATFTGKWLADSPDYLMLEPPTPGAEPEVVKYDAEDGKRTVFIGADKLVETGTKSRLFVQRVTQTPVGHKFCLETRTAQWLFDSKSGDLQKLPKEAPQPASKDSFSPNAASGAA